MELVLIIFLSLIVIGQVVAIKRRDDRIIFLEELMRHKIEMTIHRVKRED